MDSQPTYDLYITLAKPFDISNTLTLVPLGTEVRIRLEVEGARRRFREPLEVVTVYVIPEAEVGTVYFSK